MTTLGKTPIRSRCIETDRLVLRGLKDSDIGLLIEMLGNPRVMRWLFAGKPMDPASTASFIEREFTFGNDSLGLGTLCEKSSQRIIGFAGIIPCQYLSVADFEFGFALQEDSWGKGYAKEIGLAQIEYGFANLAVDRLLALAHPQNAGSLRVIEDLGMRLLKEIFTEERGPRRIYVITRGDFDAHRPANKAKVIPTRTWQ